MCVQAPVFLMIGVHALPTLLWQLEQPEAPVWFMVAVVQLPPIVWQLAQVLLVIGAAMWFKARPAFGVPAPATSWHPA